MKYLLGILVGITLLNCAGEADGDRAFGSAIWASSQSKPLSAGVASRFRDQGVTEIFAEVGTLQWSGGTPVLVAEKTPFSSSRRTTSTLVIKGEWTANEIDQDEAEQILLLTLGQWRREAEERRLLPRGFHFDLVLNGQPKDGGLRSLAELFAALRKQFDGGLLISMSLPRKAVFEGDWKRLAKQVDFFVAPIYGQRPGLVDDPNAWDIAAISKQMDRLEKWGRPYVVELVTLGVANLVFESGRTGGTLTLGDVQSLAWNRDLEVDHGGALDRGTRQVYGFTAKAATSAAFQTLKPGEGLRVIAPSTPILEEVLKKLSRRESSLYRGNLFYRLPGGGEEFGLGSQQLLNAHLGGEATLPDIFFKVDIVSRGRSRWVLTMTLVNQSSEPTELSVLDANWAQVQVSGAEIRSVKSGHFPRHQTFRTGSDGKLYLSLRGTDTIRLYAPMVKANDQLVAGPIEVRGWEDGMPQLLVGGAFITPYGGNLDVAPRPWKPPVPEEESKDD